MVLEKKKMRGDYRWFIGGFYRELYNFEPINLKKNLRIERRNDGEIMER